MLRRSLRGHNIDMRNIFRIRRMILLAFLLAGLSSNSNAISDLIVGTSSVSQNTTTIEANSSAKSTPQAKSGKSQVKSGKITATPISDSGIKFTFGSKASWSNCKAINYLLTEATTTSQAEMVASSLKTIGKSRGLSFNFSGYSKEVSRANWGENLTDGDYRPVLISFVDPSNTDMLGKSNAGGAVVNRSGDDVNLFVSGTVAINLNTYNTLKDGYADGKSKGNLLMHEFGHLIGLDHVEDSSALMYPTITERTENGLNSKESDVLHAFPATCRG